MNERETDPLGGPLLLVASTYKQSFPRPLQVVHVPSDDVGPSHLI
jgi:hypothetical protein